MIQTRRDSDTARAVHPREADRTLPIRVPRFVPTTPSRATVAQPRCGISDREVRGVQSGVARTIRRRLGDADHGTVVERCGEFLVDC